MILRILAALALAVTLAGRANAQAPADPAFQIFLADIWKDAEKAGITRKTFDLAFTGVTPDPRVIATTKRQPEYNKPAGAYVNSIASPQRAAEGKRKEAEFHAVVDAVEKKFQVDRWFIIAIWGMETSYGAMKDRWDVVRSVATLAYAKYRDPLFRNQLIDALKILQRGDIARDQFKGSWAGAMGQPQFMPSTFLDRAVDFNGDGRRDIWFTVPDVLGSTANYLRKAGWTFGMPWGFEVTIPKGFDYRKSHASFAEWTRLGITRIDGGAYPASGDGILFFPAGVPGPGFVVTPNFDVIKDYNDSDVYALAIGHLADLMRGGGAVRTPWPQQATQLPRDDRVALQKKLAALGYDQIRLDGHLDFKMRDFIRAEQVRFGMLPDGHPTAALLDRLGVTRQ